MRSLLGLDDGPLVTKDATLTSLMGATDCLFERMTNAVARELSTDDPGIGPGLLMIEGDLESEQSLKAFLGYLSPPNALWRSITGARPRPRQFLAVMTLPVAEADDLPELPEGLETLAVRPLRAGDLKAAADVATEILLGGLAGRTSPQVGDQPLRSVPCGRESGIEERLERVNRLMEVGAFQDALRWIDGLDIVTRTRCLVAAGRPDEAIEAGLDYLDGTDPTVGFLLELGALAVSRANLEAAEAFATCIATLSPLDATDAASLDCLRADIALARSDLETASAHADRASELSSDPSIRTTCANMLGKIAFRAGRHGEAQKWFRKTVDSSPEGTIDRARALHNLGLTALRTNQFGKAVACLQKAVLAADDAGEAFGGALARHNLAIALEFQGRYQASFEFAVDSLDRLVRLGRQANVPGALITVADLLLTFGDWDRATSLIAEARALGQKYGIEHVLALCAQKEGESLLLRGLSEDAFDGLLEAWRYFEDKGLQDDSAFCAARLAEVSYAAGDLDRAEHWVRTVRDMGRRTGDEAKGRALLVQGLLTGTLEGPAQALRELEQARADLLGAAQREPLAGLCVALADANDALGDEETAQSLMEEARSLVREIAASIPAEYRKICLEKPSLAGILGDIQEQPEDQNMVATERQKVDTLPSRPMLRSRVPTIVGDSEALRRVLVKIERIRNIPVPVLLLGESGTGKELFSEALHCLSSRSERPFVRVNAAAFTETLLLSELFGHEKGAFTGAHARKIGRFEAAHGGTLLLDEIGDVSEHLQTSLLRVIEEQSFERVGGTETVHVDVRLVFSTNRDLRALMGEKRFREDLFHRISGVTISIPPLRDRLDDVPALAEAFLVELQKKTGRGLSADDGAMALLSSYMWPGNIRELKNVVTKTSLLMDGTCLTRDALLREAPYLAESGSRRPTGSLDLFDMVFGRGATLFEARRELEVALIREALSQTDGNISAAAQMLGMKRPRLSQMVKEYGLKDEKSGQAREGP